MIGASRSIYTVRNGGSGAVAGDEMIEQSQGILDDFPTVTREQAVSFLELVKQIALR